jgi:hypothetical protein
VPGRRGEHLGLGGIQRGDQRLAEQLGQRVARDPVQRRAVDVGARVLGAITIASSSYDSGNSRQIAGLTPRKSQLPSIAARWIAQPRRSWARKMQPPSWTSVRTTRPEG